MTLRTIVVASTCLACADASTMPEDAESGTGTTTQSESSSGATTPADSLSTDPPATDASTTSSESDASSETAEPDGGCAGVALLEVPADPGARGPWPVGARTVSIAGLTVEVWYPGEPESEAAAEAVVYDIRAALPRSEQSKIADEDNPWQPCDCWRDLPVDAGHGPYPAIVFVHGTASFRTQSLPQMVHWASRGFVVLAADHPGLWLADTLGSLCGQPMVPQDLGGNLDALVAAVRGEVPGLEFLADRIDSSRIGMAGHSAGGRAIEGFGTDAQVLIPMAAGGTQFGPALLSTLVLGGTADSVVAYTQQRDGYAESPSPKRFVGIADGGHLTFSEICSLHNAAGDDLLTIANDNGVCGAQLAGFLFQCSPELIADADGWALVDYATAAAFEEMLHCRDADDAFATIEQRFPWLIDFEQG